ncbi:MAG: aminotransferase class V-fold PLP-dependent enzyme, partial [Eggerthellaceae bacterium]|nr:aminotransferase class V-fold PLP-dependent enzyme [Eggerthellaceae bacterium]
IDLVDLGVDAASFSGHKIGGPKGCGILYLKARTPFDAYMLGGGQENGRRSGTQNVCAMAGMAAASRKATQEVGETSARLRTYRDELYKELCAYPNVRAAVNVGPGSAGYLCSIASILVSHIESETLILRFDERGFAVSGGSECSTHSLEPSNVLTSLGLSADEAQCALRISLGPMNTGSDIEAFIKAFPKAINWNKEARAWNS